MQNTNQHNHTHMITIYTQVLISPHHAGFGMYQAGEVHFSPESSYAVKSDLLRAIGENSDAVLPIAEAITSEEFLALGVEDIRGKIYNQPSGVFAQISDGEVGYFGIDEREVADDFFG
jgi:hypothetical protein